MELEFFLLGLLLPFLTLVGLLGEPMCFQTISKEKIHFDLANLQQTFSPLFASSKMLNLWEVPLSVPFLGNWINSFLIRLCDLICFSSNFKQIVEECNLLSNDFPIQPLNYLILRWQALLDSSLLVRKN